MSKSLEDICVWITGAAGDGIAASGESFAKACARIGYHVFAYNSYQSVIRGGHVCMHIRIGKNKVYTQGEKLHYLIALNQEAVERYGKRIEPSGAVLFNQDKFKASSDQVSRGVSLIGVPVMELAGNQLMQNIALIGALFGILELEPEHYRALIKQRFSKKGEQVINSNIQAFDKASEYAKSSLASGSILISKSDGRNKLIASGNSLFGFGAVAAGCRFYSAYPMTPASSILHWMASHAVKADVLVKQAEDEIAVVNMAIGASHAGVRAMCGTSGGGFALMTEALGEAAITETPLVVVSVQRGGPSTGLPTKTEQADLFQLIGASQGDFPKVIMAPRTLSECYSMTIEAFNLAEKFQLPVLISSDLYLSERNESLESLKIENINIDRGKLLSEIPPGGYRRFADAPNGVSPRILPGTPDAEYVAATDEHDEDGITISDLFTNPAIRAKMMRKRMRKLEFILKEIAPPELEGPKDAQITLVGWGSTYSVLLEAQQELARQSIPVNIFAPRHLFPFHANVARQLLDSCVLTLAVEANYTGQLARLIKMETGFSIHHHLQKYDGEPFEPSQVIEHVKKLLKEKPEFKTIESVTSSEGISADFSPLKSGHV